MDGLKSGFSGFGVGWVSWNGSLYSFSTIRMLSFFFANGFSSSVSILITLVYGNALKNIYLVAISYLQVCIVYTIEGGFITSSASDTALILRRLIKNRVKHQFGL